MAGNSLIGIEGYLLKPLIKVKRTLDLSKEAGPLKLLISLIWKRVLLKERS